MFEIRVNGDVVYTFDDDTRVDSISLRTARGEAGSVGIDLSQGYCDLVVNTADPRARNLIDVEAAKVASEQELPVVTNTAPIVAEEEEEEVVEPPSESDESDESDGLVIDEPVDDSEDASIDVPELNLTDDNDDNTVDS